jgi:hypothetical protein
VAIEDGEEKIAVLRVGRSSMVVVEGRKKPRSSELNQVDDGVELGSWE